MHAFLTHVIVRDITKSIVFILPTNLNTSMKKIDSVVLLLLFLYILRYVLRQHSQMSTCYCQVQVTEEEGNFTAHLVHVIIAAAVINATNNRWLGYNFCPTI